MTRYFLLFLLFGCLLYPGLSQADNSWRLFKLEEVAIDYEKFLYPGYDSLIYPETPAERYSFNINTRVLDYMFWNNQLHTTTTDSQHRGVGWNFEFGVRLSSYIDVGYHHHSQHLLDTTPTTMPHFATEDTLHIKLYLYREHEPHTSVLP